MNKEETSPCDRADLVRDYAFDELTGAERRRMEHHLTQCPGCAAELDGLRLTTAALRVLPDMEVPRRIAFVSDKVFEQGWLAGIWNSAARLGFASACVLAAGLSFAAYHRSNEIRPTLMTTGISQTVIDDAVTKAVALAVDKVHAEDIRLTRAALDAVDHKYARKQVDMMVAMQENVNYQTKLTQKYAHLEYPDAPTGAGQ